MFDPLASIYHSLSLALTHFLTLLIFPFHNLPFCAYQLCLVRLILPVYCWRLVSLWGRRSAWKHKRGSAWSAAERDGYNNPCSGSAHVLNYCHKCSSARPSEAIQLSRAPWRTFLSLLHNCALTKSVPKGQVPVKGVMRLIGSRCGSKPGGIPPKWRQSCVYYVNDCDCGAASKQTNSICVSRSVFLASRAAAIII